MNRVVDEGAFLRRRNYETDLERYGLEVFRDFELEEQAERFGLFHVRPMLQILPDSGAIHWHHEVKEACERCWLHGGIFLPSWCQCEDPVPMPEVRYL